MAIARSQLMNSIFVTAHVDGNVIERIGYKKYWHSVTIT